MTNKLLFLLLSLITICYSCKDDETFIPDDSGASFKASAFVEVVGEDGQPVPGALISILHQDGSEVITDSYGATNDDGVYQLKNADMYTSTYVTVSKAGYFAGSRRFYPTKDNSHFIRIMLMEKELAGSITSAAGGQVIVDDHLKLEFPAAGIEDANGDPYTGEVRIYAQTISADDEELSSKMPGDLVGYNEGNERGALASMGMVAVELESPSGEKLQVKDGSEVTVKVKVPASKLSDAPANIDMWYFDESAGYWMQEGNASLVGDEYVAEVKHFSWWNCDAWFETVKLGVTFVFDNGEPASQVYVCLTILSLDAGACSFTNEEGFICGLVAANELMLMEVRNPCGQVMFSQQIGPFSDTTMMGPITIPASAVDVNTVFGNAIDCNGDPVTSGFAKIRMSGYNHYVNLDDVTGGFEAVVMNCDATDVDVTAYDEVALKQSITSTYPNTPTIDAGTINVCENLTELIDMEAVGIPQHYFFYFPEVNIQGNQTNLYAQDSLQGQFFYVRVDATTEGTYFAASSEIGFELPNGDRAWATGVTVTITHFGAVGDYITGTLSGTFHTGPNGQGGPDYPLAGTFTILRE